MKKQLKQIWQMLMFEVRSHLHFSYRQVCESNDYIICYSLPCLCICEHLYNCLY